MKRLLIFILLLPSLAWSDVTKDQQFFKDLTVLSIKGARLAREVVIETDKEKYKLTDKQVIDQETKVSTEISSVIQGIESLINTYKAAP